MVEVWTASSVLVNPGIVSADYLIRIFGVREKSLWRISIMIKIRLNHTVVWHRLEGEAGITVSIDRILGTIKESVVGHISL